MSLRVLHCLRAPIGGLFRHVCDLAQGQAALGLSVGVICDSTTGSRDTERALSRLDDACALGVTRVPMSRQLGWRDLTAYFAVKRIARVQRVDVLHGHGAKGGAYARLVARALKRKGKSARAFYTPHGGSLHYSPSMLAGRVYVEAERKLAPLTDGLIFESAFAAGRYHDLVGALPCPYEIIPNGLHPHEFYEPQLDDDAADFVFVGELRKLKGVDTLLRALAGLQGDYPCRAVLVGHGPDEAELKRLVRSLRIGDRVSFAGPMPARAAFARGRCVVVPSRAESFPYIVLEAAAAQMPLIATDVGGIPEIVSGLDYELVAPGYTIGLANQMRDFLIDPARFVERAKVLQESVARRFSVEAMTKAVVDFYSSASQTARVPG